MSTIADWLAGLGLGKYADAFAANDVDLAALPHLDADDLKELGVSLGHRKIMLAAIAGLRPAAPVAPPAAEAGPHLRLLSVLFCDMVGSTSLSGRFDAEAMHDLISGYQDAVAGAVTRFGGYVANLLGDGVLAYFGWPMAYEDHAERAILAGLAAIQAVSRLETPAGEVLGSRVAIATGRVVIGDLTGGGVFDRGQVAGDTPNLAARLLSIAEPGQVVIAEGTRRLVRHAFDIDDIGRHALKGFDEAVPAFLVRGERDVESRFDAARVDALSPLVGRKKEIATLVECWGRAVAGEGQTVLLAGEAGVGKSRLLEALVEHVQEAPHHLVRLQCSPYHTTSALHPVIQRLNRVAGFAAGDDAQARNEKLQQLASVHGEAAAEAAAVYAELLSLEIGEHAARLDLLPQQRKERTLRTIADRLFLTAAATPELLIVEDAHWIDPSTSELLGDTVAKIHAAPICVVVSHRPDWSADWASGAANVTRLAVGRLDKDAMRDLIEARLGEVPDALVDLIAERTDGVPLFVEELTRSLAESGTGASEASEIPDSLQGSLMARLDRLPVAAKDVAQIAAVIGREFDRGLLGEVVPLGEAALDEALRALLAAGLLVEAGRPHRMLSFRHALIQDTAYQSLLSRTRRHHHQAIADAIVRSHKRLATMQPELVARHYAEAQRDDLALDYWRRAGERALERSANYEAIDHFSQALTISSRLPEGAERESLAARLRLAEALREAGRLVDAAADFGRAADTARKLGDTDSLIRIALGYDAAQFLAGEDLERSAELLLEAMSALADDDHKNRCLIMTRLARAYTLLGDRRRADLFNRDAAALARRLRDRNSLFDLLVIRFLVPQPVASPSEAAQRIEALDELLRVAAHLDDDAKMRANAVNVYNSAELGERARMDASVAALAELGEVRQRLHVQWMARHGAAMLAILDGDFAAAERLANQAVALGRRTHGEQVEGVFGIQMFSIRREQGRLAEVAPVMKRFIDDHPDETTWLPGFALIAADLGFADAARRRLRGLAETGFEMPYDAKRSASLSFVAEVAVALEETETASRLYELLSAYEHMTVTAGAVTVCYGAASRYLGMLAGTLGEFDRAEAHFEHALEINRAMRARPWLAHTMAEYALLLRKRGRPGAADRAEALANEAWAIAAELEMVRLRSRLQLKVH